MTIKAILAAASLGLVCVAGSAHAATNLITNGGFEAGDFSGYTMTGATGDVFAATSQGGYLPEEGNRFAALGSFPGLDVLSQTFADVAGQPLQISYYLASDGLGPNEFKTVYDNVTLADLLNVASSSHLYNQVTFTVIGTGSDTLQFSSEDQPNYLALDNISVTPLVAAAPEPSTWLLMIAGVGLIGSVLRRRSGGARLAPAR